MPIPSVRWALASLSLSMLLSSLGTSIANVGLPTLAQAFNASFQDVQWVVLAYLLAITTLIVSVGRLGDIIGRRRLLLAGIVLFTVASLICGAAPTLWLLIAARAAQGLGAAIMMALTMAFVGETVPKARTGSAMGLLGTMSAIGTALGPSLGGVLIATLGWQAIFLVNVPLGLLALFLAYHHLPVDRRVPTADRTGFDTMGTLLLALTLGAYALAMTTGRGSFGPLNLALLLTAAFGVVLFVLAERRAASPLIRLAMFHDPILSASLVTERAGHDGNDGDAGRRPVLPLSRTLARRSSCRTRHVNWPHYLRTERGSGWSYYRPLGRAIHGHCRARRDGGWFSCPIRASGDVRHCGLHCCHRRLDPRLCAVPGRQQHRRHDGCPSEPAGRHVRLAQFVAQSRAHHRRIPHGRRVRARIGGT